MKLTRSAGSKWAVESAYSPKLVEIFKSVPGLAWAPKKKVWEGYSDAIELFQERCRAASIASPNFQEDNSVESNYGLRAYQNAAVDFCRARATEGCIVGLEMGLGKTPCTIAYIRDVARTPTVVVCPAYVKGVWFDELKKWWPTAVVEIINDTKPRELRADCDVYVVSYGVLHAWVDVLAGCAKGLVIDECHCLVSEKSRRAKACRALRSTSEWCVGLTGTPLTGKLSSSWNVIDTISPGRLGSYFKYAQAYCDAKQKEIKFFSQEPKIVWDFSGRSNEEELARRFKHFVFRKTRAEVASELPARTRQIIKVDCGKLDFDPALVSPGMFRAALVAAADKKLPKVVEVVKGQAEAGEPVVVFCYRKVVAENIANALSAEGVEAAVITGEVLADKRREIIARTPAVLCCTIDSCGVGISMTNYSTAVFAELTYEHWKLLQAESRLSRIGQTKPCLFLYVVGQGSVEDRIIPKLLDKIEGEQTILGDDGSGLEATLASIQETEEQAMQSLFESLTGDTT